MARATTAPGLRHGRQSAAQAQQAVGTAGVVVAVVVVADLVVLDPRATPVLASRQEVSTSLEDVLFSLMILGDDRAVKETFAAGVSVHRKAG